MKYLVLAVALVSTAALSQTKQTWTVHGLNEQYDNVTDLGKAMNICAAHRSAVSTVKGVTTIEYDDGWEDCNAIHKKWVDGNMAQKSYDAQMKKFIADVAGAK